MRTMTDLSQSGGQITVSSTAGSVKSFIQTADATITDARFKGALAFNVVQLNVKSGSGIRIMTGADPTAAIGMELKIGGFMTMTGVDPRTLRLIRTGSSDAVVEVQLGREDSNN